MSYKEPHTITIWTRSDTTDIHGRAVYTVDTDTCRYEESSRLYVNEFGQNVRANSIIYSVRDILKKGQLVIRGDFSSTLVPVDGAYEVKQRRAVTNLRGTKTEFRYIL